MKARLVAILFGTFLLDHAAGGGPAIVLGSKKFTESLVLTELAKRSLEEAGFAVEHRQGMGGTIILWEALRAWRTEEARRQELPPYVIFHDSTLLEVARRRPISLTSLATIPGVGASKLERYGTEIIGIVAQKPLDPEASQAASPSRIAHGEIKGPD